MKFGDKNFKEEFIKWLKIKSQDEIIKSLKKYSIKGENNGNK